MGGMGEDGTVWYLWRGSGKKGSVIGETHVRRERLTLARPTAASPETWREGQ
jgi:hypothetical protein